MAALEKGSSLIKPPLVAHADWSVDPHKRWITTARLASGRYRVSPPEPVGEVSSLLARMAGQVSSPGMLVGFDFPIGLPLAYARRAGIDGFMEVLPELGKGSWARFFDLAERPCDISLTRPFYPRRPGGTKRAHLLEGLGLTEADLYRRCEVSQNGRNSGCSLFWTLGGNQVGRAALAGWRELLQPSTTAFGARLGIWPFHGELQTLLRDKECIIAETYPAESCIQLGLAAPGRGWSKRKQLDRAGHGGPLERWARRHDLDLDADLTAHMRTGFGASRDGEDRFDSMIGLLAMLNGILSNQHDGIPDDPAARRVEGWIFGMAARDGVQK